MAKTKVNKEEDQKINKEKIFFISSIFLIIILMISILITLFNNRNTQGNPNQLDSGYMITGYEEVYERKDKAEYALENKYILEGKDAVYPDEVSSFNYGDTLHKKDGTIMTYQEGYGYTNVSGEPDWEIADKSSHLFNEGDQLNWDALPNTGHYVWSANQTTGAIYEPIQVGKPVDMSNIIQNSLVANSILGQFGLTSDDEVIISSPVTGDQHANGFWIRIGRDPSTGNTQTFIDLDQPVIGSQTFDQYMNIETMFDSNANLESSFDNDISRNDEFYWQGGGSSTTVAWDWGIIPGTSYRHIRLTNDESSIPEEEIEVDLPVGWYQDTGWMTTGTPNGEYVKNIDLYMDPTVVTSSLENLYKRGNLYQTTNIWTGRNLDGWYTDEYLDFSDPKMGPMNPFIFEPESVYNHNDNDDYTDYLGLSSGTIGTWKVHLLNGSVIDLSPEYFNSRDKAADWLKEQDIIDYDLIVEF